MRAYILGIAEVRRLQYIIVNVLTGNVSNTKQEFIFYILKLFYFSRSQQNY